LDQRIGEAFPNANGTGNGHNNTLQRGALRTYRLVVGLLWGPWSSASVQAWLWVLLGFCYLISPFDLIPDHTLFPLSLLDDILVLLWCAYALYDLTAEVRRAHR
jgi:uncharacterized membrane protein YkvA (DUF1232 family)